MPNVLSARTLTNVKVVIGNGEIICDDVASGSQVHQLWSWAMSLLQTHPRTTLVLVEGIFKSASGGMVRIDKDAGIYLSWRTTASEIGTEGWPDGKVRLLTFYKGVSATLYISIRDLDAEPLHEQQAPPQPEVVDFSTM